MWCKTILIFGFCLLCFQFVWSETLQLAEGSRCTWKEKRGKCVNLYRCVSAVIDIESKDPPPLCTANIGGPDPVICCTDCLLVNDTRRLVYDKKIGIHPKTGLPSQDYCLEMLHELDYPCKRVTTTAIHKHYWKSGNCYAIKPITKRSKVHFNPFAWTEELTHLAMLGYGVFEETLQWLCGGSLISDTFILTAARCLHNSFSGRVTYVGLGVRRRSDSPSLWQRYKIINYIPYPHYRPDLMYHDIALLKTAIPVLFNYHVTPICLPQTLDLNKEPAMAASIGSLEDAEENLENPCFVYLDRFNKKTCSDVYPFINSTTQLCYGYIGRNKMSCVHDRGTPLFKKNGHYPCGFTIIGITSFERTYNDNGTFHGLYTNVFYYKSWIEKVVWGKRKRKF